MRALLTPLLTASRAGPGPQMQTLKRSIAREEPQSESVHESVQYTKVYCERRSPHTVLTRPACKHANTRMRACLRCTAHGLSRPACRGLCFCQRIASLPPPSHPHRIASLVRSSRLEPLLGQQSHPREVRRGRGDRRGLNCLGTARTQNGPLLRGQLYFFSGRPYAERP